MLAFSPMASILIAVRGQWKSPAGVSKWHNLTGRRAVGKRRGNAQTIAEYRRQLRGKAGTTSDDKALWNATIAAERELVKCVAGGGGQMKSSDKTPIKRWKSRRGKYYHDRPTLKEVIP